MKKVNNYTFKTTKEKSVKKLLTDLFETKGLICVKEDALGGDVDVNNLPDYMLVYRITTEKSDKVIIGDDGCVMHFPSTIVVKMKTTMKLV